MQQHIPQRENPELKKQVVVCNPGFTLEVAGDVQKIPMLVPVLPITAQPPGASIFILQIPAILLHSLNKLFPAVMPSLVLRVKDRRVDQLDFPLQKNSLINSTLQRGRAGRKAN